MRVLSLCFILSEAVISLVVALKSNIFSTSGGLLNSDLMTSSNKMKTHITISKTKHYHRKYELDQYSFPFKVFDDGTMGNIDLADIPILIGKFGDVYTSTR